MLSHAEELDPHQHLALKPERADIAFERRSIDGEIRFRLAQEQGLGVLQHIRDLMNPPSIDTLITAILPLWSALMLIDVPDPDCSEGV